MKLFAVHQHINITKLTWTYIYWDTSPALKGNVVSGARQSLTDPSSIQTSTSITHFNSSLSIFQNLLCVCHTIDYLFAIVTHNAFLRTLPLPMLTHVPPQHTFLFDNTHTHTTRRHSFTVWLTQYHNHINPFTSLTLHWAHASSMYSHFCSWNLNHSPFLTLLINNNKSQTYVYSLIDSYYTSLRSHITITRANLPNAEDDRHPLNVYLHFTWMKSLINSTLHHTHQISTTTHHPNFSPQTHYLHFPDLFAFVQKFHQFTYFLSTFKHWTYSTAF